MVIVLTQRVLFQQLKKILSTVDFKLLVKLLSNKQCLNMKTVLSFPISSFLMTGNYMELQSMLQVFLRQ